MIQVRLPQGGVVDSTDNTSDQANIAAMQTKMANALANLENADANWATLTNAQKDQALQACVRCCAKLIRLALGQLGAN